MSDADIPNRPSPFPPEVAEGGVVLTLTPDQVYVEFAESQSPSEIARILADYQLRVVENQDVQEVHAPRDRNRDDDAELGHQLWLRSESGEDTTPLIMTLRADSRVVIAGPVYHRADHLPAVSALSFTDQLLVRVDPAADTAAVDELIRSLGAEIVSVVPNEQYGAIYQVRAAQDQDLFALVRAFDQSPIVTYAGIDWRQLSSPACAMTPNDTYFRNQWHLERIQAPQGWEVTTGTRRVIIAIIDSGCDVTHPDLVAKLVPVADRYDVLTGSNDLIDALGHGTCCAGLAAAATDNAVGVAGVAPECLVMPIRLWRGSLFDPKIHSELDIVRCVDWARTHGADVVSMSWYWDGPRALADTALEQAYQANLVLVGSAGNANKNSVVYPGSHRRVITVGATDTNDQRVQPGSPGGTGWGSQFGYKLSVMAPGVRCWTTDVTDIPPTTGVPINLARSGGYNRRDPNRGSPDGGYFSLYDGTSAAAPQVAGLAALILSVQPRRGPWGTFFHTPPKNDFLNDKVQHIIEETADKVGGYAYANDPTHPRGTWHQEMGYGRINVARALVYARDYDFVRFDLDDKLVVDILIGLIAGGPGIVLPPGGPPVPVDPGWRTLLPEQRDVVIGLAVTALASRMNNPEIRQQVANSGWTAIEQVAGRMKSV